MFKLQKFVKTPGVSPIVYICTILWHFEQIEQVVRSHWEFQKEKVHFKYPDDALK